MRTAVNRAASVEEAKASLMDGRFAFILIVPSKVHVCAMLVMNLCFI